MDMQKQGDIDPDTIFGKVPRCVWAPGICLESAVGLHFTFAHAASRRHNSLGAGNDKPRMGDSYAIQLLFPSRGRVRGAGHGRCLPGVAVPAGWHVHRRSNEWGSMLQGHGAKSAS